MYIYYCTINTISYLDLLCYKYNLAYGFCIINKYIPTLLWTINFWQKVNKYNVYFYVQKNKTISVSLY